ncbi:MAG: efflux RND transporter periplasmic adaptor subunit [Victivallis sp.]
MQESINKTEVYSNESQCKESIDRDFVRGGALPASGTLSAAAPQAQAPSVRVEEVTMIDRSEPKTYVGTVAAADTVNIVARVSGTMEKAPFKEGSMVRKGDLLFEIEDTIYAANVRSAKSVLAQMEAECVRPEGVETLPEADRDAGDRPDDLRQLAAHAEILRGENRGGESGSDPRGNDLSYTKIYSPLDGRIGSNIYSEGNYITPETGTLATIVRYDPVKIKFSMSEADFFRHFGNGNQSKSELQISRADGQPFSTRPGSTSSTTGSIRIPAR